MKRIELDSATTEDALDIIVAGDLCPIGRNTNLLMKGDPKEIYNDLQPILDEADLSIVNLECPLTSHRDSVLDKVGPSLRADPGCARGIRAAFDVVSLANNHIMDYGPSGLKETLDVCKQSGLLTVGAGQDLRDAQAPLISAIKGLRIAILAFSEHEFSISTHRSPGAAPIDPAQNYRQLGDARQQADLVLVLVHGGIEHYPLPSPQLVEFCHFLVDVGSDLVVCNHAHISSGMEIYGKAPIFYGQGNFLFDRPARARSWDEGYLVQVRAARTGVVGVTIVPYVQSKTGAGVRGMIAEEAERFLQEFDRLSGIIVDPGSLESEWLKFCSERKEIYLSAFFPWPSVIRRLIHRGFKISKFLSQRRSRQLLNMIRCESHRHVTERILADLWNDSKGDDTHQDGHF